MGLREDIQSAVSQGLDAIGNVKQTCIYRGRVGTYKPSTGWVEDPSSVTKTVQGVLAEYDSRQVDGTNIQPTDQQFIIDQIQMPGIKPTTNGRITDEDGITWNVQTVKQDPAKASWILQLRRP